MLTSTRRRLAGASLVLLVPLTASCGFGYQTDKVYQPGVGTDDRSSTVDVLASVIVSGSDGSGTYVASLANKSQSKEISLTQLSGPSGAEVKLSAPVKVPAAQLVNLANEPAITVSGSKVTPGAYLRLTFTFSDGATRKINVPVVDQTGEYADVGASPTSTASPSASDSASPSESSSPSESASPSSTSTP
ncbi:MAG: hypothetical protein JWR42_2816 [Marmoricola sp.]|nr:hypothetical protein [Marmoricola sp.]